VRLTGAIGASVADDEGRATIKDDDTPAPTTTTPPEN
jgi:hypothetical protein